MTKSAPEVTPKALELNLRAKDTKYGVGRLIGLVGAKPVAVPEHVRAEAAVMAVEEYKRLKIHEIGHSDSPPCTSG